MARSSPFADSLVMALATTLLGGVTTAPKVMGPPLAERCQGETEEADHLLRVIRIQTITRRAARLAAKGEQKEDEAPVESLLAMVRAAQETDPLAQRLKSEMEQKKPGRESYRMNKGVLL